MTDNNTQNEIFKTFQDETKSDFYSVNSFLKKYNIDFFNQYILQKSIKELKKEIEKIEIPKLLGYDKKILRTKNVRSEGFTLREIEVNIYEGKTEKEVNEIEENKSKLENDLRHLELLLEITKRLQPNEIKKKSKFINENEKNINELELIDNIFKVVLGDEIKKYSLRNFEKTLIKNGFEIDFRTLGNKFLKEDFRLQILAGIMSKKKSFKKIMDRDKLDSFEKWIDENYIKGKKIYKKNSPGKIISINDDISDFATDRKSGKSGVHPGLIQDELIDKMDLD